MTNGVKCSEKGASFTMYRKTSIFFLILCILPLAGRLNLCSAELTVADNSSYPFGIISTIYTDPQTAPTIEEVKNWRNFLYLAVRYRNGDQKLEIWNIRNPSKPVFIQSLNYGNLMQTPQDHWRFPSVNVFDDAIVVRSNFSEVMYHHNPAGEFIQDGVNDFAAGAAGLLNNEESIKMSSSGSFGTYFGCLFNPGEVPPAEEYGYRVLNFMNPRKPFITTTVNPATILDSIPSFEGHLNSLLGNKPGVLSVLDTKVCLSTRKVKAQSFIQTFWKKHFQQIFNEKSLSVSVRDQIETIVKEPSYTHALKQSLDEFFVDLNIDPTRTVEQAILAGHDPKESLTTLLAEYQIDWNDPARLAIRKIISSYLTSNLDKSISKKVFSPVLDRWMKSLFSVPFTSKEELEAYVTNIFDGEITPSSVARYVLENYLAPHTDAPDWLFWDMNRLLDEIEKTPLIEALDTTIEGANTLGTATLIDAAFALIPPAQEFYLPDNFPRSSRDVLEYIFFEHGAKLQRNGLAFMELLKFYQYFQKDSSYLEYEKKLSEALKKLQSEFINAFAETVQPFMASLSSAGNLAERMETFSEAIPCRDILTDAIVDAVCTRLEAKGINTRQTIHQVLISKKLYLDYMDASGIGANGLAAVDTLVRVLNQDLQEAQTSVKALWEEGAGYTENLEQATRDALANTIEESWGHIDLDQPMSNALEEFLGNHIDYYWTFGTQMDSLFKDFIFSSLTEYPGFIDIVSSIQRAIDGDLMARWEMTFKIAKEAAALSLNPVTLGLAVQFEAMEKSMNTAYKQATTAAVKTMLQDVAMILLRDMFGNFSAWGTATEEENYSVDFKSLTQLNAVRTGVFQAGSRIGLLPREEWDYLHPRKMSVVLFNPADPVGTKMETVLPYGWGSVDYVHFLDSIVLIAGSRYEGAYPISMATFLTIRDNVISSYAIKDYRLTAPKNFIKANNGQNLVVYGPAGLFILPNPQKIKPGAYKPASPTLDWELYEKK